VKLSASLTEFAAGRQTRALI